MRQASAVFYAAEEQRRTIGKPGRTCIEDAVDGIGPVLACEDRVRWMAIE
jgi:hypothetical protein